MVGSRVTLGRNDFSRLSRPGRLCRGDVLVQRWTRFAEVDLTALLPGGPPNRTLESVHSTVALAEQINAIPRRCRQRVLTADARETWNQYRTWCLRQQAGRRCHLRTFGNSAIARCTTSRSRNLRHAKDPKCSSSPCGRSSRRERRCSRRCFRNRPRHEVRSMNYKDLPVQMEARHPPRRGAGRTVSCQSP